MKKILLFTLLFFACFLTSCGDLFQANKSEVDEIHQAIANFEGFKTDIPYLTSLCVVYANEIDDGYSVQIKQSEDKNGLYTYKKNGIYKDDVLIIEKEVDSLDAFVSAVASYCGSTYCVGINEFLLIIKISFTSANSFKNSSNRAGKKYYTCEINDALNDKNLIDLLKKIDNDIEIKKADKVTISLLFKTDFTVIYPDLSISINDASIIEIH